jgi:hypothetical protein
VLWGAKQDKLETITETIELPEGLPLIMGVSDILLSLCAPKRDRRRRGMARDWLGFQGAVRRAGTECSHDR